MKSTLATVHLTQSHYLILQSNGVSNFEQLCKKLEPQIKWIARSFPSLWFEDFVQEGFIALNKAYLKYDDPENPGKFLSYAKSAIRTGMIDFSRARIKRAPKLSEMEDINFEEEETVEFLQQIVDPTDWAQLPLLRLDIEKNLSKESMRTQNYPEREIRIFELYFKEGLNLTEVAKEMGISISQVSRIVTKLKISFKKKFNK